MRRVLGVIVAAAIVQAGISFSRAADKPGATKSAEVGKPFFAETVYLPDPVGNTHRIRLTGALGEVGGKGTAVFDGNSCTGVNEFGDVGTCTKMFFASVPIEFTRLRLADPAGRDRRVFQISGKTEPSGVLYYLVTPREGNPQQGPWRLVVEKDKQNRRAITLESTDKPKSPPVPAARPVSRITSVQCAIDKSNSPNLTVTAVGEVPTLGWTKPSLTRVVYVQFPPDGIWDYNFTAIPPTGPVPSVISPVQAADCWKGYPTGKLKGIRIHCASGPAWEVRFGK